MADLILWLPLTRELSEEPAEGEIPAVFLYAFMVSRAVKTCVLCYGLGAYGVLSPMAAGITLRRAVGEEICAQAAAPF